MRPRYADHAEHLRIIREAVLRAADPFEAVRTACLERAERETLIRHAGYVAIGKAAVRMRDGMLAAGGSERGITVAPGGFERDGVVIADHPLPTERSVGAGEAVREFVEACATADAGTITLLLSGGASALVCAPAEGVTLGDLRAVTSALLQTGAMIGELNAVRKHAEQLKGGRLARLAAPCRVDALVLSDVIGDDLDVIASGPVAPDPTTFADALAVLERHRALDAGPTLTTHLRAGVRGEVAETPKPGDALFGGVLMRIVASNATALDAARDAATALGFRIAGLRRRKVGDAAEIGRELAMVARFHQPRAHPLAVLFGGETTVNVGQSKGKGGRNQETALAAAVCLAGFPRLAAMSFATDGVDGPTDAAGAVVNSETCWRARELGLDPLDVLRRHDSYGLLDRLGCLIRTGPTGTNVNDIVVALAY